MQPECIISCLEFIYTNSYKVDIPKENNSICPPCPCAITAMCFKLYN
jgi:hypothetical protein